MGLALTFALCACASPPPRQPTADELRAMQEQAAVDALMKALIADPVRDGWIRVALVYQVHGNRPVGPVDLELMRMRVSRAAGILGLRHRALVHDGKVAVGIGPVGSVRRDLLAQRLAAGPEVMFHLVEEQEGLLDPLRQDRLGAMDVRLIDGRFLLGESSRPDHFLWSSSRPALVRYLASAAGVLSVPADARLRVAPHWINDVYGFRTFLVRDAPLLAGREVATVRVEVRRTPDGRDVRLHLTVPGQEGQKWLATLRPGDRLAAVVESEVVATPVVAAPVARDTLTVGLWDGAPDQDLERRGRELARALRLGPAELELRLLRVYDMS